jgi:hypothetical protein
MGCSRPQNRLSEGRLGSKFIEAPKLSNTRVLSLTPQLREGGSSDAPVMEVSLQRTPQLWRTHI